MALPGSIPEVDPKAAALADALEAVNPIIKELAAYQKTRDFQQDGFKLAREREKPLEDGLRRVIAASDAFSHALIDRHMALDEKRLAGLKEGSLPYRVLATSIKARVVMRRYDALNAPADVPAFLTALDDMRTTNRDLATALGALSPKADTFCGAFSASLDALVGHGRDLAGDVRAKRSISDSSASFAHDYNNSVEYYGKCVSDEPRANG